MCSNNTRTMLVGTWCKKRLEMIDNKGKGKESRPPVKINTIMRDLTEWNEEGFIKIRKKKRKSKVPRQYKIGKQVKKGSLRL